MSIRQGGNIIAGLDKYISLEIGDIGCTRFKINEAENKRRILNGQKIDLTQFDVFKNKLLNLKLYNPEQFVTEEEWKAEASANVYNTCDKFVLDELNNTVKLPKYPDTIELIELNAKAPISGNGKALGLKYGATGQGTNQFMTTSGTIGTGQGVWVSGNRGGAYGQANTPLGVSTDPNKSGIEADLSSAKKSTKLQVTYFIQVAIDVVEKDSVINEYQLNNPYSLLDCKWSDHKLSNVSWLLSEGQFNSGTVYVGAYNLLVEQQATPSIEGLSVKKSDEVFTDYDFVINTIDKTFRLPIKTKLASGSAIKGNGTTLGLTDGIQNSGSYYGAGGHGLGSTNENYGKDIGLPTTGADYNSGKTLGITTDSSKSGIETDNKDLYLYYYVGETIENANLIDVGKLTGIIVDKLSVIDSKVNPDGSWYRLYSDGWLEQGGRILAKQNSTITVPLAHPLINNTYQVFTMPEHRAQDIWGYGQTIPDKTTTDFQLYVHNSAGSYNTAWYACGQGA